MNSKFENIPHLEEDPFNYNGSRHWDNTPLASFNCGGFALETYSWYLPQREFGPDYDELDSEENVSVMLEEFPDLRCINSMDEALPDENIIAFRKSVWDFHYVKYNPETGLWDHKMGSDKSIFHKTTEQVFSDDWGHGYEAPFPVILMAKKKLCLTS